MYITCRSFRKTILAIICLMVICVGAWGADDRQTADPQDLTNMSLENLMNMEVTSVSKKSEKLVDSAAAVYVVTAEDIRRSGATSIPEALRMVPGLYVAKIDANKWVVSSRGFSERYTNKLLVLIDGRSVYTPLFAGVYWDVQDVVMEDIDRIEVIRGPGATMWGANAVDGVINIITKSSASTQGTLASEFSGTETRGLGAIQYGGKLSENADYRVYGKYLNYDDGVNADGQSTSDGWQQNRRGFRVDWDMLKSSSLMIQGDFYNGSEKQEVHLDPTFSVLSVDQVNVSGSDILAKWTSSPSTLVNNELQLYYDSTDRSESAYAEKRDTIDLDFQQRRTLNNRHEIVWGAGYRRSSSNIRGSEIFSFSTTDETTQLFSAFCQDDITLVQNRTKLTIGSKFEHNSYTGLEIQPNIRFLWTPRPHQTIWASVSRAVRTPSEAERDAQFTWFGALFPDGNYYVGEVIGNKDYKSEDLLAYETGYRVQPSNRLSFDLTAYYNIYNNYRSFEMGTPQVIMNPFPYIYVPLVMDNLMNGKVYGWEIASKWNVTDSWNLSSNYTYCKLDMYPDPQSKDVYSVGLSNCYPKDQFQFRSSLDLPKRFELDAALYCSSVIPDQQYRVPKWSRVDIRLGWKKTEATEISVGVQNLLQNRHKEAYATTYEEATYVPRNIYAKVTWHY